MSFKQKIEEIERYYNYSAEHNTWSVNFLNTTKLTESEVKDIFDKFGAIRKVIVTVGIETGSCFVNFLAQSSAVKCVKEMKNHHIIQLRPFRYKIEKQTKNKDFTKFSSGAGSSSFRKHEKKFRNSRNDLYTSTTSLASMESSSSGARKAHAQENRDINSEMADSSGGEGKNESISNESVGDKGEIVTAHEVIVANVHEAYGENFVLDLLRKYKPIAASKMKSIPQYSLHYCHVYFMTAQQAQAVESNYDRVKLVDQDLIVLRVTSLSEEANSNDF